MNLYPLFPTLVCEDFYYDSQKFKKIFFDNAFNHITDGESGEASGNVIVHLDPAFEDFFSFVSKKAKEYVSALKIDPEIFDFNIVKTWLNITRESDNPKHEHGDAHMSFSYYVHVPDDVEKYLTMYRPEEMSNELYHGMLDFNVQEYNEFNCMSWYFPTEEGKIFLFPSKIKHSVMSKNHTYPILVEERKLESVNDLAQNRICIAGDFVLTHKQKTTQALGLQPIKNWKTY